MCRLELEKQEAAKAENYEEAMEKKEKIEFIRQELARNVDLDSLLSASSRPHHYSRPVIVSHQKLRESCSLIRLTLLLNHEKTINACCIIKSCEILKHTV